MYVMPGYSTHIWLYRTHCYFIYLYHKHSLHESAKVPAIRRVVIIVAGIAGATHREAVGGEKWEGENGETRRWDDLIRIIRLANVNFMDLESNLILTNIIISITVSYIPGFQNRVIANKMSWCAARSWIQNFYSINWEKFLCRPDLLLHLGPIATELFLQRSQGDLVHLLLLKEIFTFYNNLLQN